MGEIVVVSGTDTGVGKTWVGCRLGAAAHASGIAIRCVKLVETGTTEQLTELEDGVLLAQASKQHDPVAALRRYRLPVAAAVAAEKEGIAFDLAKVVDEVRDIAGVAELTLVEGAGGLLAPLTWDHTLLDVALWLDVPILLVAPNRLGTINHSLLSIQVMRSAGVRCSGVILNALAPSQPDASIPSNGDALRRLLPDVRIVETTTPSWESEGVALLRA